jgi:hypothetical protein
MSTTQRTVDDIAGDIANAATDAQRAALLREMDAANDQLATEHLRTGNIPDYQVMIGHTRQAHRGSGSNDVQRTRQRMANGEL